uniref:ribosomal protein L5 n=1 Tax=Cryptomonas gyropyrenoidosa TaxID=233257 RepID=UPI0027A9C81E|nr:ribosomal protein L5 [Cryptomonas gyropyrenoidosa]WFQ82681.1 ribosomal protein L5 [Cryptomonas gyropyrenoidosa]
MKLKSWYNNVLKVDFIYKVNLTNSYKIPTIKKVCINICSKFIIEYPKRIFYYITAIKLVTNTNPKICKSEKSISSLKLRKGMIIGLKLSLKNVFVYDFMYLFIMLIIPNLKSSNKYNIENKGKCMSIGVDNLLQYPQLDNKFTKNVKAVVNLNITNTNITLSKILLSGMQLPQK